MASRPNSVSCSSRPSLEVSELERSVRTITEYLRGVANESTSEQQQATWYFEATLTNRFVLSDMMNHMGTPTSMGEYSRPSRRCMRSLKKKSETQGKRDVVAAIEVFLHYYDYQTQQSHVNGLTDQSPESSAGLFHMGGQTLSAQRGAANTEVPVGAVTSEVTEAQGVAPHVQADEATGSSRLSKILARLGCS